MRFHVSEQSCPIDSVMCLQDQVRDVGAVVAVAKLDEGLGQDEFRRRDDRTGGGTDLYQQSIGEPGVGDDHGSVRRGEDDVEEGFPLEDLTQPSIVLDFDGISKRLEMIEDAGVVARLAEDVEILGRPRNAGMGADGEGTRDQERNLRPTQLGNRLGNECFGFLVDETRQRERLGRVFRRGARGH